LVQVAQLVRPGGAAGQAGDAGGDRGQPVRPAALLAGGHGHQQAVRGHGDGFEDAGRLGGELAEQPVEVLRLGTQSVRGVAHLTPSSSVSAVPGASRNARCTPASNSSTSDRAAAASCSATSCPAASGGAVVGIPGLAATAPAGICAPGTRRTRPRPDGSILPVSRSVATRPFGPVPLPRLSECSRSSSAAGSPVPRPAVPLSVPDEPPGTDSADLSAVFSSVLSPTGPVVPESRAAVPAAGPAPASAVPAPAGMGRPPRPVPGRVPGRQPGTAAGPAAGPAGTVPGPAGTAAEPAGTAAEPAGTAAQVRETAAAPAGGAAPAGAGRGAPCPPGRRRSS